MIRSNYIKQVSLHWESYCSVSKAVINNIRFSNSMIYKRVIKKVIKLIRWKNFARKYLLFLYYLFIYFILEHYKVLYIFL